MVEYAGKKMTLNGRHEAFSGWMAFESELFLMEVTTVGSIRNAVDVLLNNT